MEIKQVEDYRNAGQIARQAVDFARKMIKKDMLLVDLAEKIEAKITGLGGGLAFPVNLSLNDIAAHYTPGINDKTIAEGLITVDLGVEINGCIADTAFSLDLSEDKKYSDMIKLNELALKQALERIGEGTKVGDIGTAIQDYVEDYNKKNKKHYSIIKNLTGHSLGENTIHAGLTIPNYRNEGRTELKDVAIAIEPFITEGLGEVYEGPDSEIFMLIKEGQTRDKDTRELLKFIKENYSTRPFCRRWLEKNGFKKLGFSLSTLKNAGLLHNFPVLIERSKMPVSQAEHTILINDKIEITTK
jgi:methionyl aminopeptidase